MTDLGLFDFDEEGHVRLRAVYPGVSVTEVQENTGFQLRSTETVETVAPPDPETIALIRRLDPLRVHEQEIRAEDRQRRFAA